MKKKLFAIALVLAMVFALAACGGSQTESSEPAEAGEAAAGETDYSVITTDTAKQTVTIYAQVNGKYFTENSRHGVVFKEGSNGEKCIFRGLCSEKDFYGQMIAAGFEPGDNLPVPCEDDAIIEGQPLSVTVTWEGQDEPVPFEKCIKTGDGKEYVGDWRFGGNIKKAYKANTGCILCIESCPVGIVSNAAYGYGVIENTKKQQFFGNDEVVPEDGTIVQITFAPRAE